MTPEERRRQLQAELAELETIANPTQASQKRASEEDARLADIKARNETRRAALPARERKAEDAMLAIYGPAKDSAAGKAMGQFGSFGDNFINSATLGNSANVNAALNKYLKIGGPGPTQGDSFADYKDVENQNRGELREAAPEAAMLGDLAGFIGPGGLAFKGGTAAAKTASRFINPSVRAALTPTGANAASKGVRYTTGVLTPAAASSAADFGLYNATVGGSNQEADEGRRVGLGERAELFKEGAMDPLAWAAGPGLSFIYRGGRGVKTLVENTAKASKESGGLVIKKGSFTPQFRADQVEAQLAAMGGPETPRTKALKMIRKRMKEQKISVDNLRAAIQNIEYGGYSSVDEMLFELAGASNDQLAVALGAVKGEAKKTAAQRLNKRSAEAPARMRHDLRRAMGLEGDDFYALQKELKEKRFNEPEPLYEAAYGKQVSQSTWEDRILPVLTGSPSAREAVDDAIRYASDVNELGVARELAEFRGALDSEGARPSVLSTQALDFVDRMLGDMAQGVRQSTGRRELARGPSSAQSSIRGDSRAGLDVETGIDQGRTMSQTYRNAGGLTKEEIRSGKKGALQFGRQAFKDGVDIETLLDEFASQAEDLVDSETVNSALIMGWLRGAEDEIARATNPGTVIRKIYGSERQRAKLLEMLPKGGEEMSSGQKADLTKRIRALVGDKKSGRKGRFERERDMFDNQQRVIRGSQTAERTEAIAEQGGTQDKVQQLLSMLGSTRKQLLDKALEVTANRVTRPGIYDPEVNRELGDLMFTSGAKDLRSIADEIEAVLPKKRAPVLASGTPPRVSSAGIPALGNDAHNAAAGGMVGGVHPDFDQDGEISLEERLIGIFGGAAGGAAAGRIGARGGNGEKSAGLFARRGNDVSVLDSVVENPSKGSIQRLWGKYGDVRLSVDADGKVYAFNGWDYTHSDFASESGKKIIGRAHITSDPKDMKSLSDVQFTDGHGAPIKMPGQDGPLTARANAMGERVDEAGRGPVSSAGFPFSPMQALDAISKPIERGIQGAERRLAGPDDPRHYGPDLARMGVPDEADPTRALYDQVADPREAARLAAEKASIEGGDRMGRKAVEYVAEAERGGAEGAGNDALRRSMIAERRTANQALKEANAALIGFIESGGAGFRTKAAKQAEQARLLAVAEEAKRRVQAASSPRYMAEDATSPEYLPDRNQVSPERAQMITQEMERVSPPSGANMTGRFSDVPDVRPRTGRDARAPVDERMADLMFDPEMAAQAAQYGRESAEGFAPRPWAARALAASGTAAVGSGAVYAADKISDASRERTRRAEERQIDTVDEAWDRMIGEVDHMPEEDAFLLQAVLAASGVEKRTRDTFSMQDVDGVIGADTRHALKQWQKKHRLPPTGYVSRQTLEMMKQEAERMGLVDPFPAQAPGNDEE